MGTKEIVLDVVCCIGGIPERGGPPEDAWIIINVTEDGLLTL